MTIESSLPSYSRLFPDLDLRGADDTRSVCSPAAYLADLLQLLHDHFENPALVQRRPAIEGIPLDAANTYTTLPYLDIVNEVLAAAIGTSGAFETLGTDRYPAALPFVLRDERVRVLLGHLGVDAAELYVLFAEVVDPDKTARLRLGLSVDDVDAIVTPYPGAVTDTDADDFARANGLSAADLRAVLATAFVGGGNGVAAFDAGVRDRAVRFVRLARKTGLAFPDLDLMVRTCCAGRLDEVALRTVAALLALGHSTGLPVDAVCSLVAPLDTSGLNGTGATSTLFDRVFNAMSTASAPALVPAAPDSATNGRRVLACAGDILAPRNREFRARVCRALGLTDADLTAIVERFRGRAARWVTRPFDRTDTVADLSLLHRLSRLVTALDTSVTELFDVLDVVDADPSFPAALSFSVPVAHWPTLDDPYRMLDAAEIDSSVCLVQALFAIVPWMRTQGLTGAELAEIVGSAPAADQPEVLRNARRRVRRGRAAARGVPVGPLRRADVRGRARHPRRQRRRGRLAPGRPSAARRRRCGPTRRSHRAGRSRRRHRAGLRRAGPGGAARREDLCEPRPPGRARRRRDPRRADAAGRRRRARPHHRLQRLPRRAGRPRAGAGGRRRRDRVLPLRPRRPRHDRGRDGGAVRQPRLQRLPRRRRAAAAPRDLRAGRRSGRVRDRRRPRRRRPARSPRCCASASTTSGPSGSPWTRRSSRRSGSGSGWTTCSTRCASTATSTPRAC